MKVVTNKFEMEDEKITGLEERIKNLLDNSEDTWQIKNDVVELKATVKNFSFPTKEMRDLSTNLVTSVRLLKQPVQDKVLHYHYIPKLLWITIGLLFLTCFFWCDYIYLQKTSNNTKPTILNTAI